MDIVAKARDLETRLARTVDRAAARVLPAAGPREPLEIAHAVVEAVEREVQPAGRGRHLFPFNRIGVWVLAPSRQMSIFVWQEVSHENVDARVSCWFPSYWLCWQPSRERSNTLATSQGRYSDRQSADIEGRSTRNCFHQCRSVFLGRSQTHLS